MKSRTLAEINEHAFLLGKDIKVLGNIAWPENSERDFLEAYLRGRPILPAITYIKPDYSEKKKELKRLLNSFSAHDSEEIFTRNTIQSFLDAIELNQTIGTSQFTEKSSQIFGVPGDLLPGSNLTNIQAAEQVVQLCQDFDHPYVFEKDEDISAEDIDAYLSKRIVGVFGSEGPKIHLTDSISAKATASATTIKLKKSATFTHYDFKQLFYHEVMTHSLTAINGRSQSVLKLLGCSSLRTLKTQEGLATFSEIITGSLDISRLKRICLRILAIDMALSGANFTEIFEYFLSMGQSKTESFNSTQRIFRGGFPDKNIVFTKDAVYLDGLINVHTLFRWAMKTNRLDLTHLLFCGRLSIEDIFYLEQSYRSGVISSPQYLPAWYSKMKGLAGTLIFSLLANVIQIKPDYFDLKAA